MGNPSGGPGSRDAVVRVVIIDDDLFVRTTLTRLLDRNDGIAVIGAFENGHDAVEAMRADPPDIALVDISMPEVDGMETTRMLKAALPSVGVLALTSLASEQAAADMLRAGAMGFLMKDTPVAAMVHSIRSASAGLVVLSGPATRLIATGEPEAEPPALSDTEQAVLKLVAQGLTNAEIAPRVYLSASTVKYHIGSLMTKLGAHNRVALAIRAHELGFR